MTKIVSLAIVVFSLGRMTEKMAGIRQSGFTMKGFSDRKNGISQISSDLTHERLSSRCAYAR
jgi:hypothetical protein